MAFELDRSKKPAFKNPPVAEIVLGIQFQDIQSWQSSHFGLYFGRIRDRYGVAEDQQRLLPIMEPFPRTPVNIGFQLRPATSAERVWFREKGDGNYVVQVQPDRFAFNWRRTADTGQYPGFNANLKKCLSEFDEFRQFCKAEELGEPSANLVEVAYINHVFPAPDEGLIDLYSQVLFDMRGWPQFEDWLPKPEIATFNRVFELPNQRGRLYAEASIALDKSKGSFLLLKMTCRVNHLAGNEIQDELQLAHDWVVNGFVATTSSQIRRERWQQTR